MRRGQCRRAVVLHEVGSPDATLCGVFTLDRCIYASCRLRQIMLSETYTEVGLTRFQYFFLDTRNS